MSKFEQEGVDRQLDAVTACEAKRAFAFSCKKCATTGKHIDCEQCNIAHKHQFVLECFAV